MSQDLDISKSRNRIKKAAEYQSEKQAILPLMELYYTLQGEGMYVGKAAIFVRLAGCDVGCAWCDVKESWPIDAHPDQTVEAIVAECASFNCKTVVITGGEPLMYQLDYLTEQLKVAGMNTHIETSGAYPLSGDWDWICLSPKKFKKPLPSVLKKAQELKVVVFNKSDFEWAQEYAALVSEDCALLLQPEWSKKEQMLPQMVDFVKLNPEWRISIQTHKYMGIP